MRHNPTHTYKDSLSPTGKRTLAQSIHTLMRDAFGRFPVPSQSEILESLDDLGDDKSVLFSYTAVGNDDSMRDLKAFLFAQRYKTFQHAISHFEIPTEFNAEDFPEHEGIADALEQALDFIKRIYSSGNYILDVSYFGASPKDGEKAQQDYAARVFLPFLRNVLMKDRPVVWGHMRADAYKLVKESRLEKIRYTIVYDQVDFVASEELRAVVLVPNELLDRLDISKEELSARLDVLIQML